MPWGHWTVVRDYDYAIRWCPHWIKPSKQTIIISMIKCLHSFMDIWRCLSPLHSIHRASFNFFFMIFVCFLKLLSNEWCLLLENWAMNVNFESVQTEQQNKIKMLHNFFFFFLNDDIKLYSYFIVMNCSKYFSSVFSSSININSSTTTSVCILWFVNFFFMNKTKKNAHFFFSFYNQTIAARKIQIPLSKKKRKSHADTFQEDEIYRD